MLPLHCILVPTDFSDSSRAAFHLAAALARDHNARLVVLHVQEIPVTPPTPFGTLPASMTGQPVLKDEFVAYEVAGEPMSVEHMVVSGSPAEEIVRAAGQHQCELIVMGTHGHTGVLHLIMGSVTGQVMRTAPCAVLTLRRPLPAAEQSLHAEQNVQGPSVDSVRGTS